MNKTFDDIFNEMLAYKNSKPLLSVLDSSSKSSLWKQFLEVCTFGIYNFQNAVNLHLKEIKDLILKQKTFNLRRYCSEALKFQYGFDLEKDSDQFKSTYVDGGSEVPATTLQIEQSKIVKFAASSRIIDNGRVKIVLKIAPDNLSEIFTADQINAFVKYLEEVAPAGDHVSVVNYLPDILKFAFKIKYDPMVLLSDGMNILTGQYPVNIAIETFLKNLPFNGELSVQKLESAILSVDGVEDLQTLSIETKWIEPAVIGYGVYQPVNMSVIPASGRFKVEDFTGLQFIV